MLCQEPLRFERCHAAAAGGRDGLLVDGILHVARGKDTRHAGSRAARLDVSMRVELQLPAKRHRIGHMADGDK